MAEKFGRHLARTVRPTSRPARSRTQHEKQKAGRLIRNYTSKMSDDEVPTFVATGGQDKTPKPLGMRKNGKQWHEAKKAFRPTKGLTSYERRTKERAAMAQMKAKEKEMKEEKEEARKLVQEVQRRSALLLWKLAQVPINKSNFRRTRPPSDFSILISVIRVWPATCITHVRVLGGRGHRHLDAAAEESRRNIMRDNMSTPNNGVDLAKQASPSSRPSSRHQIKRSLTEFASPSKLHRRPHPHRRQESQLEDREKPPLSSAILAAQIRNPLDIPVSTGTSSCMTPGGSRRASILVPKENGHGESREKREASLLLEQEKASLRTDGLKQSLMELNSFATSMTKRLDDTYYSVLERMSTLQNTVAALRDLAQSSHDICETFDKHARDLESDIIRQLSTAGNFEEQQRKIAALQKRIYEARGRTSALATRVDVVQKCVERWEQADRQWQEKTLKKLKIIWSATTIVALIVVAFVIGMNYASTTRGGEGGPVDWNTAMSPNIPPWMTSRRNDSVEEDSGRTLLWKAPPGDAEQLRGFDEL
ncbi:hypothetical protein C2857_005680 [Epichloe festucae Fl1]|uniref:Uncharacterized protein n=1 Tax=Epichloe festucae (strain Fl1) TaxID=877507 RepID=A0A7S9PVS7_EPIFF|nr:hypothetical protein C2857_005680 [Epichloe festucae Fl1]